MTECNNPFAEFYTQPCSNCQKCGKIDLPTRVKNIMERALELMAIQEYAVCHSQCDLRKFGSCPFNKTDPKKDCVKAIVLYYKAQAKKEAVKNI